MYMCTVEKIISEKLVNESLVWALFTEGAYLTFKSIFHKALNLF